MADTRIALGGTQPDYGQKARTGWELGTQMQDRPEQRQINELQAKGATREDAQNVAVSTFGILGPNFDISEVTIENVGGYADQLRAGGVEIDVNQDGVVDERDVQGLSQLYSAGQGLNAQSMAAKQGLAKPVLFKQEEIMVDDEGALFNVVTSGHPNRPQETRNIISAMDGTNTKPSGKLRLTSKTIETADDAAAAAALKAAAIAKAQNDTNAVQIADLEFQKSLGSDAGGVYAAARGAAQQASQVIPELLELQDAVSTVKTGKWSELRNSMKEWTGWGDVTDHQVLNAKLMGLAQDILAQQTGTKTDFDFQVAVEQVANMGNTPEANKLLIDELLKRQRKAVRFGEQVKSAYEEGGAQGVLDAQYKTKPEDATQVNTEINDLVNKYAD
jgi:hypothetical protein